jgi:hypothetical protein
MVFLWVHRRSVLLHVPLEFVQRLQLLWTLLARIRVLFSVDLKAVLLHCCQMFEAFTAEVAGESKGRRINQNPSQTQLTSATHFRTELCAEMM